jgi:hypothetical protein
MVADWVELVETTNDPTSAFKTISQQMKEQFENGNCMPQ